MQVASTMRRPLGTPTVAIDSLRLSVPDMDVGRAHQITERALMKLARSLENAPNVGSPLNTQRTLERLNLRLELTGDSNEALEQAIAAAVERALLGTEE